MITGYNIFNTRFRISSCSFFLFNFWHCLFNLFKECLEDLEEFFRLIIHLVVLFNSKVCSHERVLSLNFFKLSIVLVKLSSCFIYKSFEYQHEIVVGLSRSSYLRHSGSSLTQHCTQLSSLCLQVSGVNIFDCY